MTGQTNGINNKYQGLASSRVIHAVQKAASRTGANFSFLMEKASTESNFNPSATSSKSSATGLFQFIESTWLNMVKDYGHKYGLGNLADQIQIKGGKPTCEDCTVKDQILKLRNNPEISALMAGEYSEANKTFLESHTGGEVGATELYLAHFMGPNAAARFINDRVSKPDASAARLFPQAAHVNKGIFFENGKPRTLNEVYALFANKFSTGGTTPDSDAATPQQMPSPAEDVTAGAPAPTHPSVIAGQAPSLLDAVNNNDIIWSDDPRFKYMNFPAHRIASHSILALAESNDVPATGFGQRRDNYGYNS